MAQNVPVAMPPHLVLGSGYTLEIGAIDASGADVAGVIVDEVILTSPVDASVLANQPGEPILLGVTP